MTTGAVFGSVLGALSNFYPLLIPATIIYQLNRPDFKDTVMGLTQFAIGYYFSYVIV
jgi:hypothetical protein